MKTQGASHVVHSTQGQIELSKMDQHVYVLEPTLEEAIEALREFLTVAADHSPTIFKAYQRSL